MLSPWQIPEIDVGEEGGSGVMPSWKPPVI